MGPLRPQPVHDIAQHRIHLAVGNRFLPPITEHLDKTAHVGPFVFLGQVDRQADAGKHRLERAGLGLDLERQMHVIDTDFLNRNPPQIGLVLDILHQRTPSL